LSTLWGLSEKYLEKTAALRFKNSPGRFPYISLNNTTLPAVPKRN
jgi:hypothetical protein